MSQQQRNNEYYLRRLKAEHPSVYADYQAGKFKNASEAFAAAGLRRPKSGLTALKSAWNKATATERDAFKVMIGCGALPNLPAKASHRGAVIVASVAPTITGRKSLSSALEADVRAIISRRGLKIGDIMREMGRKPLDASLGLALRRGMTLAEELLNDLEAWVRKNGDGRP